MPTSFLPRRAAAWTVLAAAATVVSGAPVAVAADNGDVKIHEVGTPFDNQSNQPKVCDFYLDAFNFKRDLLVTWSIETQPSIPGGATRSGSLTIPNNDGSGHTMPIAQLPNGMYKLTWTFTGENGAGKHKVFKVDCPSPPPGGSTGGTGGGTGGPNGGPPAGGGGLARDAALSPLAGAAAVGLTAVGGAVWFRLRRRPHGAS
ncbi:hypothetical protein ACGFY9_32955 [Streptomyces sp. NPDC048504]|uniref:hypothetical protein n=1 Tax=Streptomyces sp. NPDC048504 TaxID=3365559 RepID=UPI0037117F12